MHILCSYQWKNFSHYPLIMHHQHKLYFSVYIQQNSNQTYIVLANKPIWIDARKYAEKTRVYLWHSSSSIKHIPTKLRQTQKNKNAKTEDNNKNVCTHRLNSLEKKKCQKKYVHYIYKNALQLHMHSCIWCIRI